MNTSTFQVIGYVLLLGGVIAFGAAVVAAGKRQIATAGWRSARGGVVDLVTRAVTPGNPYSFPVIEFTTHAGQTIRFEADLGFYPSPPKRGQQVPVVYDPADPRQARLNTPAARWFVPGVWAGFGFISSTLGYLFVFLSR
jgi:hypothetical protein